MEKSHIHKVALVTGSGKPRIGNVIAHAAANEGYDVAIHYNTSQEEAEQTVNALREKGVGARAFQADVRNDDDISNMVEETLAHFGRIDLLVTCAGVWPRTSFEEASANQMLDTFKVNTLGTFLCCQKVGLAMAKQAEGGSIVCIGDWATERPYLEHASYFTSKGSLPTLTRVLAKELAARNPALGLC